MGFTAGQKLKVVETTGLAGPRALKYGDIVTFKGMYGTRFADVDHPTAPGQYFLGRFEPAPEVHYAPWWMTKQVPTTFVPKFRKGQKLEVTDGKGSDNRLTPGTIVTAAADSYLDEALGEEAVVLGEHARSWFARRFKVAQARTGPWWAPNLWPNPTSRIEKKAPGPTFRKGQKLRVLDGGGSLSGYAKAGDVVEALEDSLPGLAGVELVWVKAPNQREHRNVYVKRFEVVSGVDPEFKVFEPKFKKGRKLILRDADGIPPPWVRRGTVLEAQADSRLGHDGKEIVDVNDTNGHLRTFYASRFEAVPTVATETYLVLQRGGSSELLADLNELDAGETVAVYKFDGFKAVN